jgi:hypothetical protein
MRIRTSIRTYTFGNDPALAFEEGGVLEGFSGGDGYREEEEARVARLYKTLGVGKQDSDYQVCRNTQGRLALVGLTCQGWRFALEEKAPR